MEPSRCRKGGSCLVVVATIIGRANVTSCGGSCLVVVSDVDADTML